MDAASMRRGAAERYLRKIDWGATAAWLFGFGIVAYLGLKGGGYDPLVSDQVGIAVWWILLAGVLVGALPRRDPGTLAWAALGLLAAFDAFPLLREVDGVIAVTRLGRSTRDSAERLREQLERLEAPLLGIVANGVKVRRGGKYGYGYYGGYYGPPEERQGAGARPASSPSASADA